MSGRVPSRRQPFSGHVVHLGGHIVDARRIDPVVVELEEGANGDCIVERFVRPARGADAVSIGLGNCRRIVDHLLDEAVESAVLVRDRRRLDIVQNALDDIAIPVQLRRDRGV